MYVNSDFVERGLHVYLLLKSIIIKHEKLKDMNILSLQYVGETIRQYSERRGPYAALTTASSTNLQVTDIQQIHLFSLNGETFFFFIVLYESSYKFIENLHLIKIELVIHLYSQNQQKFMKNW